jgi:putative transposase
MRDHEFPSKLHHEVRHWVEPGALFHIRIALNREIEQRSLADPSLAPILLESARFYAKSKRWQIILFILMLDHLHALLSFARDEAMSKAVGDWKHFHSRRNDIIWQ